MRNRTIANRLYLSITFVLWERRFNSYNDILYNILKFLLLVIIMYLAVFEMFYSWSSLQLEASLSTFARENYWPLGPFKTVHPPFYRFIGTWSWMLRFNSYHVFTAASITSFIQRSTERARVHQIYHRRILFYGPLFREHFWKNQTPDLQRHFQILNHLGLSIGRIGRTREPLELTSHCDFLFLRGGVLTPRPLASFYRVDFFRLMNTLDRGELGVVKIRDEYSWHSARIFFFDTHSLHASELGSCDHVSRNQKRVNSSATFRPPPPKLGTIHMPVT